MFIISDTTFEYEVARPFGANSYWDFFEVDKKKYVFNLKIGMEIRLNSKYYLDTYLGIGFAYRNTKHFERENMNDEFYDKIFSIPYKVGISYLINVPFNLKIGYIF